VLDQPEARPDLPGIAGAEPQLVPRDPELLPGVEHDPVVVPAFEGPDVLPAGFELRCDLAPPLPEEVPGCGGVCTLDRDRREAVLADPGVERHAEVADVVFHERREGVKRPFACVALHVAFRREYDHQTSTCAVSTLSSSRSSAIRVSIAVSSRVFSIGSTDAPHSGHSKPNSIASSNSKRIPQCSQR
jgi:hypothetical protein